MRARDIAALHGTAATLARVLRETPTVPAHRRAPLLSRAARRRVVRVAGLALVIVAAFALGMYAPLWDAMPWAVK